MNKGRRISFLILVLFMSWISLFHFYGPLLTKLVSRSSFSRDAAQTAIIAAYFSFVSLFTFLIKPGNVKKLMDVGLIASICVSALMWFRPETQALLSYVFVGAAAGVATVSYSYIYVYSFTPDSRVRYTALYFSVYYSVAVIFGYAASILGDNAAFALITLLPIGIICVNRIFRIEMLVSPEDIPKRPFPRKLILLMGAIIFITYLNTGIEANLYNMGESLNSTAQYNITQVAVLLIMFFLSSRIHSFSLIYCGFIFKGISYVLYMLTGSTNILIPHLVIASISVIDLFNFCMIGNIALKYGYSFTVFRISLVLGAVGAIMGELAGNTLMSVFELDSVFVSGIALIVLLISLLIMPLLQRHIGIYENPQKKPDEKSGEDNQKDYTDIIEKLKQVNSALPKGNYLTPKEMEVAVFLIERFDYVTITQKLYITENTLKSHIKRIYQKFDVSGRKELAEQVETMFAAYRSMNANNSMDI